MKSIIIIILAFLAINVSAQQVDQNFANDTTNGATSDTTTSTAKIKYNGFVTFDVVVTGAAADDTATVTLEGSNNSWVTADSITSGTQIGTTAANIQLIDNPAKYLNYRAIKSTGVGDTSYYSNQRLIFKR